MSGILKAKMAAYPILLIGIALGVPLLVRAAPWPIPFPGRHFDLRESFPNCRYGRESAFIGKVNGISGIFDRQIHVSVLRDLTGDYKDCAEVTVPLKEPAEPSRWYPDDFPHWSRLLPYCSTQWRTLGTDDVGKVVLLFGAKPRFEDGRCVGHFWMAYDPPPTGDPVEELDKALKAATGDTWTPNWRPKEDE